LDVAERFAARRTAIGLSPTLTAIGKQQAMRDALPTFLKELAKANLPIKKMRGEIKARRAALQVPQIDRTDTRGAIEDAEIRSWFSALDLDKRQAMAMTTTDARILRAIVNLPDVAGLVGPLAPLVEQVKQRYVELTHSEENKSIEAMEAVAAEMSAAAQLAKDDIRRASGADEGTFDKIADPIEKEFAAPKLFREKDGHGHEQLYIIDLGGRENPARLATADEIAGGIVFESAAASVAAG
jgi:hypothetical protein